MDSIYGGLWTAYMEDHGAAYKEDHGAEYKEDHGTAYKEDHSAEYKDDHGTKVKLLEHENKITDAYLFIAISWNQVHIFDKWAIFMVMCS